MKKPVHKWSKMNHSNHSLKDIIDNNFSPTSTLFIRKYKEKDMVSAGKSEEKVGEK